MAYAAVTIYGAWYQAESAKAQGKSEQNLAEYNAQIMERNAQIAEQRKRMAERAGTVKSRQQAKAASRQQSKLLANLGASGAVIQTGAPLDVLAEQASESEIENMMIGYDTQVAMMQAQSEADSMRHEAQAELFRGDMARTRGKNRATASYIGAGGTLLSGFGGKA